MTRSSVSSLSRWLSSARLAGGGHEVDALVDLVDGAALRGDLDLLGVLQDLRGELGDVTRHGGREQQRLALLGDRGHDAAHVADEAHVEHAIGLVEDEEGHVRQLDVAALDQVEKPARRGDQDVDAAVQGLDLPAEAQAADHHAELQPEAAAVGVEAAADLDGELARRRQHQRPRMLGLRTLAESGEVLQDGQREGGGLAGAGLGDAQHVAALQQCRDGARLDRRGHGVAGGIEGTQQRLGEAEIRKRNITHWKYSPFGRRSCLSGTRMERLLARSRARLGRLLFWGLSRDEAPSNERRVARSRETFVSPQTSGLARI